MTMLPRRGSALSRMLRGIQKAENPRLKSGMSSFWARHERPVDIIKLSRL